MQLVVNKLIVNYQTVGNGRVIILIHGWGDDLKNFRSMQASLAKSFKVIALDLPGFGGSSAPYTGWSLEDFASFINDFVDKLGLSVYGYVGHSNGGAILIKGLANNLIEANKLVLISAAGLRNTDRLKKRIILVGAKIGKLPLRLLPTAYQKRLQKRLYQAIKSDADVSPQMIQTFKKIVKQDVSEDAMKLSVKTLLIYGKNDRVTPPEYGQIYHNLIRGSRLEIVSEAGHFVHLEEIDRVLNLVKDFLK